ncbi:MAG: GNAT family N-acetyltransferase [Longibaculum sp.]
MQYIEVKELDQELYDFHCHQKQYYQLDKDNFSYQSLNEDIVSTPPGFENHEHHCYKINKDHQLIGYIDYLVGYRYSMQHDSHYIWIGLFLIDEKVQNCGYGHIIIQHFLDLWKNQYKSVQLGCMTNNEKGLRFWQSFGFEKIAEAKAGQNDCIVLELQLTS